MFNQQDLIDIANATLFFLVYNLGSRPALIGATPEELAVHQQIGYMRADASVETAAKPAANSVNLPAGSDRCSQL